MRHSDRSLLLQRPIRVLALCGGPSTLDFYGRRKGMTPEKRNRLISNVASEATEQIKRYRLELDTFPTDWPEMDDLVSRMDQLRAKLDSVTNPRTM